MTQLISTETEYIVALEKLKELRLANPDEGSEQADELELLSYLVACYERHGARPDN